jgi:hypothetical protein
VTKGKHQPGVKRACNDCRQQKVGEHLVTTCRWRARPLTS